MRPRTLLAVVAGIVGIGVGLLGLSGLTRTRPTPSPPSSPSPRLVVLSPALAVIVRDLGLAPLIVGRHGFDMALPPTIPVCGDQAGIDVESLLRVHPTMVLTELGAGAPARLLDVAGSHGWQVQNFTLLTLDDIVLATDWLARALGSDAARADDLRRRMASAWSARPGLEAAGRVLLIESIDPPAALGPGSFHHQILERIGAAPAIATGAPYIALDAEDLLRIAPDAIVWVCPRARGTPPSDPHADAAATRARLGRIGTLDLPAFRHGHVALIDDPLSLTPSTAMIDFADQLAAILDRWARDASPSGR